MNIQDNILFYDTETTKLVKYGSPSNDPDQPHLVQVAARLVNAKTRICIASMNMLVIQEDWEMNPKALEAHGITRDHANQYGYTERDVVNCFLDLWLKAGWRVAYNEPFDSRIMRIALKRYRDTPDTNWSGVWSNAERDCALRLARKKMPGIKHDLSTVYKTIFGHELNNAHDAMADTLACEAIYWHLADLEVAA